MLKFSYVDIFFNIIIIYVYALTIKMLIRRPHAHKIMTTLAGVSTLLPR